MVLEGPRNLKGSNWGFSGTSSFGCWKLLVGNGSRFLLAKRLSLGPSSMSGKGMISFCFSIQIRHFS